MGRFRAKRTESIINYYKRLFKPNNRDKDQMDACRKEVFQRDNYRCQMPDCKKKAKHAHHIMRYADSPSLRYQVDNMISLCVSHHKEVTGQEANYIKLFSTILAQKDEDKD